MEEDQRNPEILKKSPEQVEKSQTKKLVIKVDNDLNVSGSNRSTAISAGKSSSMTRASGVKAKAESLAREDADAVKSTVSNLVAQDDRDEHMYRKEYDLNEALARMLHKSVKFKRRKSVKLEKNAEGKYTLDSVLKNFYEISNLREFSKALIRLLNNLVPAFFEAFAQISVTSHVFFKLWTVVEMTRNVFAQYIKFMKLNGYSLLQVEHYKEIDRARLMKNYLLPINGQLAKAVQLAANFINFRYKSIVNFAKYLAYARDIYDKLISLVDSFAAGRLLRVPNLRELEDSICNARPNRKTYKYRFTVIAEYFDFGHSSRNTASYFSVLLFQDLYGLNTQEGLDYLCGKKESKEEYKNLTKVIIRQGLIRPKLDNESDLALLNLNNLREDIMNIAVEYPMFGPFRLVNVPFGKDAFTKSKDFSLDLKPRAKELLGLDTTYASVTRSDIIPLEQLIPPHVLSTWKDSKWLDQNKFTRDVAFISPYVHPQTYMRAKVKGIRGPDMGYVLRKMLRNKEFLSEPPVTHLVAKKGDLTEFQYPLRLFLLNGGLGFFSHNRGLVGLSAFCADGIDMMFDIGEEIPLEKAFNPATSEYLVPIRQTLQNKYQWLTNQPKRDFLTGRWYAMNIQKAANYEPIANYFPKKRWYHTWLKIPMRRPAFPINREICFTIYKDGSEKATRVKVLIPDKWFDMERIQGGDEDYALTFAYDTTQYIEQIFNFTEKMVEDLETPKD
eukprot:augustus_masked-scaffold_1-processed-gene-0.5-mRNA-1 protein AED:1.00 eAED:1.00 QI:0/-1/0/0/-1/1/1/0/726